VRRRERMTVKSVSQAIHDLAKIHADRRTLYGDDFLQVGEALVGFFPRGLTLRTAVDFNRFVLFLHQVTKVSRYAQCMARGHGHQDSLDDLSIYAQLLQHFDSVVEERDVQGKRGEVAGRMAEPGDEPEPQRETGPEILQPAPQPPPMETQEAVEAEEAWVKPLQPAPAMPRAAFTARVLTPVGVKVAGSKS
jgi:hypothetical protein